MSQRCKSGVSARIQRNQARALIQLGYTEGRKGEWINGFSYLTQAQNLLDDENNMAAMAESPPEWVSSLTKADFRAYGLIQYERAKEYFPAGLG